MPTVFKKPGSQYWHYDFRLRGRGRFYGSTELTQKAAAQRYLDAFRASKIMGEVEKPQMTLDVACDRYWLEVAEKQPSAATTEYQLANLIDGLGKATLLSEITDSALALWIARRRGSKHSKFKTAAKLVSAATVNREVELLKRIINRADEIHKVAVPKIAWKKHRLDEGDIRDRTLTADQERRLFAELVDYLHNPVRLTLLTGLRLGNVVKLDWSEIDMRGMRFKLKQKGNRNLSIPFSHAVLVLLANIGPKDKGRVFLRPQKAGDGSTVMVEIKSWRTAWEGALRRAGIEDFRFHDLRHTMASRMVAKGKDIGAVSKALGHTTVATTMRYAHYSEAAVRDALESLTTDIPKQDSEISETVVKSKG